MSTAEFKIMLIDTKPRIAKEGRNYVCRNLTFDRYRPVPIVGVGSSARDSYGAWLSKAFDRVLGVTEYEL